MRNTSRKRQRRNTEAAPVRDAFSAAFSKCMVCRREAHDIHEIARGSARDAALDQRCALLRLCRSCHDEVHRSWTVCQQYVLKALMDTEHFDRQALNVLRGVEPDAISEMEMWMELPVVLRRMRWYPRLPL